jgi:hypothetical protein
LTGVKANGLLGLKRSENLDVQDRKLKILYSFVVGFLNALKERQSFLLL